MRVGRPPTYTRGTYLLERAHTNKHKTQTNTQRGPTKYDAGSRRGGLVAAAPRNDVEHAPRLSATIQSHQTPPSRASSIGLFMCWLVNTPPDGRSERHTTVPRSVQSMPGLAQNRYQDPAYLAVVPRAAWASRPPEVLQQEIWSRPPKCRNRLPGGFVQIGDGLDAQAARPDSPRTLGAHTGRSRPWESEEGGGKQRPPQWKLAVAHAERFHGTWANALSRGAASDAHASTGKPEPAFESAESALLVLDRPKSRACAVLAPTRC